MKKGQALVVSAGLAGLAVAGAAAAMHATPLGLAAPRRATVAASAIAAQQAKLDKWSVALAHARGAHPPALPAVPRFPVVQIPAAFVASSQPVAPVTPSLVAAPRAGVPMSARPAPAAPKAQSAAAGTPSPATTTTGSEPEPTTPTTTDAVPPEPTTTVVVTVPAPPVTTGEHSDDGHGDDHGDHSDDSGASAGGGGD